MTNKTTKIIFIVTTFIFLVIFGGIVIAGIMDKTIFEKLIKTVVVEKEEPAETTPTTNTQTTPSTNNNSSNNSANSDTSTSTTTQPTGITAAQLATHNTSGNCWVLINGNVYNVSSYSTSGQHPTSSSHFVCGKDNSSAFNGERKHSASVLSIVPLVGKYAG
jgi:cytochrome b involved in lipid metabolism